MSTIQDVAREAGVSTTTVSRHLNGRIELPTETAARVDAAVARLQYRPNLLAKRLSLGTSETIGLMAPEIANPFFAELAAAAQDEADQQGFAVLMSSTRGSVEREVAALSRLRDRHVDGLLVLTNRVDDGTLARAISAVPNVVLLDEDVPGAEVPRVFAENEVGAYLATRHLIENGHRRIAHVGGPEGLFSTRERLAGFRRALAEAGLAEAAVHLGAYSREHGAASAERLLGSSGSPTAIFAGSDFIAIGLMRAARGMGTRVPADVSLVGFDDMPFSQLLDPALTTVRQPAAEIGRVGVRQLLRLINKQAADPVTRLAVELVERQSVARRHAGD
ncbi:cytochrome-c peroxidase [Kaistia algarum]|uniref:LacI family DNA-binding transcriptional regulator n=1 Tax=Kaistia algarum TaxID=2083279 RepID=UPI000CE7A7E8|nr:LacI family DNA-binding transcriptional regulator [Kaistia algarum]MCX5512923.1 LacI family DNA-binding transcriptional regulator [Kaistia algarum]PPE81589.1 cytochrome-c peroxidase [Kaistia algarum]